MGDDNSLIVQIKNFGSAGTKIFLKYFYYFKNIFHHHISLYIIIILIWI